MTKSNRVIVAVISDTHSGSVLGLCNPEVELETEDGTKKLPDLSDGQQYLWKDVYLPAVEQIKQLAGKDKIFLLHLGDVTQGSKFAQELMADDTVANQIIMGEGIFDPWIRLKNLQAIRIAKGTGAHNFGAGSSEILISRLLSKNVDAKAIYYGYMNMRGCVIDYAHHGPSTGMYQWTKGNVARSYLRSLVFDSLMRGEAPPKVVLRGHYHSHVKEFFQYNNHESWVVVCPSLCLLSEYVIKVTRSGFEACNGAIALEIIDGKLHHIHTFIKSLSLRLEESFDN